MWPCDIRSLLCPPLSQPKILHTAIPNAFRTAHRREVRRGNHNHTPNQPTRSIIFRREDLSTFCSASGVEKGDVVQVTPFRWGSGSIIFELKSDVDLVKLEFDTKALVGSVYVKSLLMG